MDNEKLQARELSDEEINTVSGGAQDGWSQLNGRDVGKKRCSSFDATGAVSSYGALPACRHCSHFHSEGSGYYCDLNKQPNILSAG